MRTITISLPPEAYASYQELSQATGETPEEAMSRLLEEFLRLTAGLYQELKKEKSWKALYNHMRLREVLQTASFCENYFIDPKREKSKEL